MLHFLAFFVSLSKVEYKVPSVVIGVKSCRFHLVEESWIAQVVRREGEVAGRLNDWIVLRKQVDSGTRGY